jgi:sulfoacetaldehyde acetyltransferase
MVERILQSPVSGMARTTPSEVFVEVLVANGVTDVFGIIGSANMDALDIFPASGIRYVLTAHEQGAGH